MGPEGPYVSPKNSEEIFMPAHIVNTRRRRGALAQRLAAVALLLVVLGASAVAGDGSASFQPGNLVVSRSVYDAPA
jgi:hypothetical protein